MTKLWAYIGVEDFKRPKNKFMGLPPSLPHKPLKEEDKLPIGTLINFKSDINSFWKAGFYIVIGYWYHGHYGSGANWGYKEIHNCYCVNNMLEIALDFTNEDKDENLTMDYEIIR